MIPLTDNPVKGAGTRTVWFDLWRYDRKVEVWAALLHTILAELEQKKALREQVGKPARAATWLSLRAGLGAAVAQATAGVIGKEEIGKLLDAFTEGDAEEYRRINAFECDFRVYGSCATLHWRGQRFASPAG